jgi:hypothetical protein
MLKNSVISHSGQTWKLAAACVALLVGSFAPLVSASGLSWTSGTIVAIVGYLFGVLAIRCGQCSNRWLWAAALDAGLYGPLLKRSLCPRCGHDFDRKEK